MSDYRSDDGRFRSGHHCGSPLRVAGDEAPLEIQIAASSDQPPPRALYTAMRLTIALVSLCAAGGLASRRYSSGPPPSGTASVTKTQLAATAETLRELIETLLPPKFDRYVRSERRDALLRRVASLVEIIDVLQAIRASRDPKDDKFLEAAVNGRANVIMTGDRDLLDLNAFRGIAVVTPADYLARGTGRTSHGRTWSDLANDSDFTNSAANRGGHRARNRRFCAPLCLCCDRYFRAKW